MKKSGNDCVLYLGSISLIFFVKKQLLCRNLKLNYHKKRHFKMNKNVINSLDTKVQNDVFLRMKIIQ